LLLTRSLLTRSFDTCARRYPSVSRSLLLLTRPLLAHSFDTCAMGFDFQNHDSHSCVEVSSTSILGAPDDMTVSSLSLSLSHTHIHTHTHTHTPHARPRLC